MAYSDSIAKTIAEGKRNLIAIALWEKLSNSYCCGRSAAIVMSMKNKGQGNMIRQKREDLGISQAELARRIGIKQPSLHNIEIGKTKHSRHLPEIYEQLGMHYRGNKPPIPGGIDIRQSNDFPVFLMRPEEGGNGMELSEEPTEVMQRPAVLATVPEAFGICVWGNENHPVYKSGDIVFVHPNQPPVIGADVVMRPTDTSNMSVHIGELKGETAKDWNLAPYNGEEIKIPKSGWRCDRVVGKYNRR